MARTIAVSEEVYILLKKSRGPKDSFSKVIKRSLKRRTKLSDIAGSGTISKTEWEKAKAVIKKSEEITRSRMEAMT